jgi:hypothetical protein
MDVGVHDTNFKEYQSQDFLAGFRLKFLSAFRTETGRLKELAHSRTVSDHRDLQSWYLMSVTIVLDTIWSQSWKRRQRKKLRFLEEFSIIEG